MGRPYAYEKIALLDELPRIKREGIAAQRRGVCDS
jgi:hypothetical protein